MSGTEPYLGEISVFAGNFAPRGWALCNGQLIPISQNTALFSLLGTIYGGNGTTTFALPNFQSRIPMGMGNGPGLSSYVQGEEAGQETVTLLSTQMPQHSHSVSAVTANATSNTASGGQLAKGFKGTLASSSNAKYYSAAAPNAAMSPFAVAQAGGSQPHQNMMPTVGLTFIIATQGIFPPRQ